MRKDKLELTYEVYSDISELPDEDRELLIKARQITSEAYAPYSKFQVGAAARIGKKIITGTNQENASFPVGICAERSLLSTSASLYPGQPIDTLAISYLNKNENATSGQPISPCGMCRQALQEYETRGGKSMRIILGGQEGEVYILNGIRTLLPFGFTSDQLK